MGDFNAFTRHACEMRVSRVFRGVAWQSLGESNPSLQVENLAS